MPAMGTIARDWIQKIEKLLEKTFRLLNFIPSNAPVSKEWSKDRKVKRLHHFSKHILYKRLYRRINNTKLQQKSLRVCLRGLQLPKTIVQYGKQKKIWSFSYNE